MKLFIISTHDKMYVAKSGRLTANYFAAKIFDSYESVYTYIKAKRMSHYIICEI